MADRSTDAVILIVEDEPILRMLATDVLEDAGFRTLAVGDADEAILILEGRSDVGLVFTDIDMPGSMNGARLAQCIRGRWPPIRLVVTSGHCLAVDIDLPADSVFIAKPYDGLKVVEAIRRLAPRSAR